LASRNSTNLKSVLYLLERRVWHSPRFASAQTFITPMTALLATRLVGRSGFWLRSILICGAVKDSQ
jgi:hypothetical protein